MDREMIDYNIDALASEIREVEARLTALRRALGAYTDLRHLTYPTDAMGRPIAPKPPTSEAILTVLGERPYDVFSGPEILDMLEVRGWAPESENPIAGVRAALQRLLNSDMVVRPRHGEYQFALADVTHGRTASERETRELLQATEDVAREVVRNRVIHGHDGKVVPDGQVSIEDFAELIGGEVVEVGHTDAVAATRRLAPTAKFYGGGKFPRRVTKAEDGR